VKDRLKRLLTIQQQGRERLRARELSLRAQKERAQLKASLQEQEHLQQRMSRIRTDNLASIFGEGTLTASGGLEVNAVAFVIGSGELIVIPSITFSSIVALQATGALSGSGYIYGQEWSDVAEESNTWTPVAVESNTWTPVTAGSNTWAQNG